MVIIETGTRVPTEQDVEGSSATETGRGREDYRGGDKRSTAMEIEENGDPYEEPSHLSMKSSDRDEGFLKPVVLIDAA